MTMKVLDSSGLIHILSKLKGDLEELSLRITTLEEQLSGLSAVATSGSYKDLQDLPVKLNDVVDYSQGE